MDIDAITNFLGTTVVDLLVKIAAAIAFWVVGRWLIGKVIALLRAAMDRNQIDPTLTKYLGSVTGVVLNITLVLGILGYFGIQTTSFAALLGNFAAGAFMLVLRPFKAGDFVDVGGVTGTVHELGLFGTTIVTPDNVLTTVGNAKVFGETIRNFSALPLRRVDRVAQLGAGVDPLDAIARLRAAVERIPNVSKERPPEVALLDFALEGPQIAVRPFTHNDHYWQVYFDTNEAIAEVVKAAGWPAPARPVMQVDAPG